MRRMLLVLVLALAVLAGAADPAGAWTWPADGAVIQAYVFDHEQPKAPGQHRGIDVGGALGAVVRAPASGVVSFAGTVPSNGKCVTIDAAGGLAVTLTHLGSITVTKGATVAEGDGVGTIGPSDESGVSDPHVHLGLRWTDDEYGYIDPATLLPLRQVAAEPESTPAVPDTAPPAAVSAEPPAPAAPPVAEPLPVPAAPGVAGSPPSGGAIPPGPPPPAEIPPAPAPTNGPRAAQPVQPTAASTTTAATPTTAGRPRRSAEPRVAEPAAVARPARVAGGAGVGRKQVPAVASSSVPVSTQVVA